MAITIPTRRKARARAIWTRFLAWNSADVKELSRKRTFTSSRTTSSFRASSSSRHSAVTAKILSGQFSSVFPPPRPPPWVFTRGLLSRTYRHCLSLPTREDEQVKKKRRKIKKTASCVLCLYFGCWRSSTYFLSCANGRKQKFSFDVNTPKTKKFFFLFPPKNKKNERCYFVSCEWEGHRTPVLEECFTNEEENEISPC